MDIHKYTFNYYLKCIFLLVYQIDIWKRPLFHASFWSLTSQKVWPCMSSQNTDQVYKTKCRWESWKGSTLANVPGSDWGRFFSKIQLRSKLTFFIRAEIVMDISLLRGQQRNYVRLLLTKIPRCCVRGGPQSPLAASIKRTLECPPPRPLLCWLKDGVIEPPPTPRSAD